MEIFPFQQIKSILVRGPFQYLSMSWSDRAPLRCALRGPVLNSLACSARGQMLPQPYHSPTHRSLCPLTNSSAHFAPFILSLC